MSGASAKGRVIVVFDILGTLFPLKPIGAAVCELLSRRNPSATVPESDVVAALVYSELLKDATALSYADHFTPITSVLSYSIKRVVERFEFNRQLTPQPLSDTEVDSIVKHLSSLPPRSGAVECIRALAAAQYSIVALSNGSISGTRSLLEHAAIADAFTAVHSSAEVARSKPDPAVYRLIPNDGGADDTIFFVSVHSWDVHGAMNYNRINRQSRPNECAHIVTVFVGEEERRYVSLHANDFPDVYAENLNDACQKIQDLVKNR